MASDTANALESVRALRAGGYSPKQIARALHLRPAVVAPLVRKLAAEEAAAAPEPALFGCWVSPGWSRNLTTNGHRDWPDLPVPEDGPAGIASVAVARRHRPHRVSVCGYLVDTYCLGVKNALGPEVMNERDLPGFLHDYFTPFAEVGGSLAVPLELARHLVWGAVDHARSLGFEPAPDFTAAAGHLGSWAETSAITFGRDATPFYVAGPYDNPEPSFAPSTESAARATTSTWCRSAERIGVRPATRTRRHYPALPSPPRPRRHRPLRAPRPTGSPNASSAAFAVNSSTAS